MYPGMTLREARAMCPLVVIVAPNPVREAGIAQQITDRLDDLSLLVESDDIQNSVAGTSISRVWDGITKSPSPRHLAVRRHRRICLRYPT